MFSTVLKDTVTNNFVLMWCRKERANNPIFFFFYTDPVPLPLLMFQFIIVIDFKMEHLMMRPCLQILW